MHILCMPTLRGAVAMAWHPIPNVKLLLPSFGMAPIKLRWHIQGEIDYWGKARAFRVAGEVPFGPKAQGRLRR